MFPLIMVGLSIVRKIQKAIDYWSRDSYMERVGAKIAKNCKIYCITDSNVAIRLKGMKLTEQDIKNIMYGTVKELSQNRNYFYNGYRSHWTDEGKRVIGEMMDLYADKIQEAIREADDIRAREMVFNSLKEENK